MLDKVEYCSKKVVEEFDTAQSVGSGILPVFATPMMVALMENAAMNAIEKFLKEGETSVGSELNIKHLYPSHVGATIKATATLLQQEGRKLIFSVSAFENDRLIGEGTHIRYIVNIEKFMAR